MRRTFINKVFMLFLLLTAGVTAQNGTVRNNVPYMDRNGAAQTQSNVVEWSQPRQEATLADGWYLVTGKFNNGSNQWFMVTINGDVHLILADACSLSIRNIIVEGGSSLTIYAQSTGGSMGKLIARGGTSGVAGIGGNNTHGGNITINGGEVTATGSGGSAGIGGGVSGAGGNITINGGRVTADGSAVSNFGGAGIGGGSGGNGGNITINGGTVTANGNSGAGIGGGRGGDGGDITITGGTVTANANATFGSGYAGIGGSGSGSSPGNGGNIRIEGGTVTATGVIGGAGIGGSGENDNNGGTITITGGTVTASGGRFGGAGIGGGRYGTGGVITIRGGAVTATGGSPLNSGNGGAGIGGGGDGGASGDILIYGGNTTVTAVRGNSLAAAVGGGSSAPAGGNVFVLLPPENLSNGSEPIGNTVTFFSTPSEKTITADLPAPFNMGVHISTGGDEAKQMSLLTSFTNQTVVFRSDGYPSASRTGAQLNARGAFVSFMEGIHYIDQNGVARMQSDAAVYAGETTLNNGWYLVRGTHNISSRITVNGDNVHLILEDGCDITLTGGISVHSNRNLTIYAQSTDGGMGKLTANAPSNAAGIGGISSDGNSGTITINGGTVTATGGNGGAGIGGGRDGAGGTITINGGMVTATGGIAAAGIGGGNNSTGTAVNGGIITIRGGTVTATSGGYAAGIGGGMSGNGGTITISGGTVTAVCQDGSSPGAGIGGGHNGINPTVGTAGNSGNILIYGANTVVTATRGGSNAQDIGHGRNGNMNNVFVLLPHGNLRNNGGITGNTVNFTADSPVTNGTVDAILPAPFSRTIQLFTDDFGTGTEAKDMSLITSYTALTIRFNLTGEYNEVSRTGTQLNASGASVDFLAPPSVTTTSLPNGAFNTAYSETLTAFGATPAWSVTDGSLPPGLSLNSSTGVISGTPTAVGTFNFTVSAENTLGNDTKVLSITIDKADQSAPSAPTLFDKSTNTITLDAIINAEYSMDGGMTWQDGAEFDGLSPFTEYTFTARLKETPNYNASPASVGLTVMTDCVHNPGVAATCENPQMCTICGAKLADALGHDWDNWVITPATCLSAGDSTRICKRDPEHTEVRVIAALDHVMGDWVITPASCYFPGDSTRICERAACTHEIKITIPQLTGLECQNVTVSSPDRTVPPSTPKNDTALTIQSNVLKGEFTAGPNPVSKSSGNVNFFVGAPLADARIIGTLTIYDAQGNVVNKIQIKDKKDAKNNDGRRIVGSWDLTDRRGRAASEGTYLVRGTITDINGRKEKVSLMIGIR